MTLSMLGLLLASGFASAQTPPPASNGAPQMNRLDRLGVLLDLTPQQKLQVQQVLQEQRQQMQAFWQQQKASGAKPNFQALRAERQQLRQQTLAQLQQLLNENQYNKLQVLTSTQGRHHWRHRPPASSSGSSSSSSAGE